MLIGTYQHNIDAKGRMNFPAKFREELGEKFYITLWLDDCLVAFPEHEWNRLASLLAEKSVVKSRDIFRYLYANAILAEPDKQGRILIPQQLRAHAGLEKEASVLGVGSHVEIWNPDKWNARNSQLRAENIAAAMEELEF